MAPLLLLLAQCLLFRRARLEKDSLPLVLLLELLRLPVLELELERENDPALKDAKDENLVGLSFWGSSSCSSLAGNFPALRLVVLADLFFEVVLALDRLVLVVDSSSSLLSLLLFVLSILDDRPVGLILKLPILAFCSRRVDLLVVPGTLVLIRVTGVSVISLG